jgi:hypothetical protein
MTAAEFARARLFTHVVCRALDRAYRAASRVEAAHPGLSIDVMLAHPEKVDELDLYDLPPVRFMTTVPAEGVGLDYVEVLANVEATARSMVERIEGELARLTEPTATET